MKFTMIKRLSAQVLQNVCCNSLVLTRRFNSSGLYPQVIHALGAMKKWSLVLQAGWSLKSGQIYKKNYQCVQTVVFHERWSMNSGISDKFYCT